MKVRLYYATGAHVNQQMSATCASMFRCRRNTAVRLCPIYKMYFNHTIEPLQHVKQAHWLPCIISCFKFQIA